MLSAVIACTASELASTPTVDWRVSATQTVIEREATFLAGGSRPAATPNVVATNELIHATQYAERSAVAEKTVAAEMRSRIDASDPKNGVCVEGLQDIVFGDDLPGEPGPSARAMAYAQGGKGEWPLNDEHWKWCRYTERDKCHLTDENGVLVMRLYGLPNSDEKYGCPTDEDLKHKQSYCWTVDNKRVYNASCPKGHEEYWSPRGWTRN